MAESRIWLNADWYIPVDINGYVQGPCFEGMLGCVMQVRNARDEIQIAAMKIPRLLADTNEQNAYICKLTEYEMNAVKRINALGGNLEGLIQSQFFQVDPLIQPRLTQNSAFPEARAQEGHVIFVSFERDKKPRFCAVKYSEKQFNVFPEGCRKDFEAIVHSDDWYQFQPDSSPAHLAFSQPVFRSRDSKESAQRGALTSALTGRLTSTWYAAVPSIIFQWASGNLQEMITRGEIGKWLLKDHFTLFDQIMRGVCFLHANEMIHGDVRPANIMCIGSSAAGSYRLGDYGSYGREWQALSKKERPGGLTQIGPAIGQRRQTAFYSSERRAGNEYESADTAIITTAVFDPQKGEYHYVILLGWRSALLKDKAVSAHVKEAMTAWGKADRRSATPSADELQRGDRLRLRNYLFEVVRSEQTENYKLFLCSGRFADILHDSLIVYKESAKLEDWSVLDLSNYVEYHQWAAASDLFSVGAVFLYSLFSAGLQNNTGNHDDDGKSNSHPDRLFVEMIEILESVPYFRVFWDELEVFRQKIEELYHQPVQPSPAEAAQNLVLKDQTLKDMALFAVNNILQSTPKARMLLKAFDHNLAHFLLFMHFVLACLHRRSHMSPKGYERAMTDKDFLAPFAIDRIESPQRDGAAARALARLGIIRSYLDQPFFREFKCEDEKKILDFDPRSDFQIRIEAQKRRNEILKIRQLRAWPLLSRIPEIRKLVENADIDEHKSESNKTILDDEDEDLSKAS